MKCEQEFFKLHNQPQQELAFCPYRISPLGAHIDHQFGKVTGFAINKGIHIAYTPDEQGIIEVSSLNYPERKRFSVTRIPPEKVGDWADHLRGAAKLLAERYPLTKGLRGVIEGSLTSGGISSSAAVIIAFLAALCQTNGISLSEQEMILLAKQVENEYLGVSCGKLDQSCEVLCEQGKLLYLDTANDRYQRIETPKSMKPYRIAILFSGLERSLQNSSYNLRVDECKSAAYALLAFAGMEYGKYKDTRLRDVPFKVFEQYKDRLPELWRRRAQHYYSESARVESGIVAWRDGDLEQFGQLMFASGQSSIENYECGCPELIRLYELLKETDGVYGGRFSGAGFKGCCVALIDPEKADEIETTITAKYLESFPELTGKYSFHLCDSADGVGAWIKGNMREN